MRASDCLPWAALSVALLTSACGGCGGDEVIQGLKREGEPCTADNECETSLCEALPGGQPTCMRTCANDCLQNELCSPLAPDRFACVPEREGLCGECQTDADCPYPADRCISVGGVNVCGRDCSFDGQCPDNYTCAEAVSVTGDLLISQCQPQSGTCACTAQSDGQTVPCEATNAVGTCMGVRTCTAQSGYSACNARIPSEELCDGIDNDCNGETDENLGTTSCGQGLCAVTVNNCVNGESVQCVPLAPGVEVCDGQDNDCDGEVDEDWDKQTDVAHCGACGNDCAGQLTAAMPHGAAACIEGGCALQCDVGRASCDAVYANGCEVDVLNDPLHCGGCFNVCAPANTSSATCDFGACTGTCLADWGNCDLDWATGCEADLRSDPVHCGACGATCPARANATSHCSSGTCAFTCNQDWWDVDGDPSNGCEYNCVFQSATDVPDLQFVDTNCDGIDGEVSNAIFVSPQGDDSNPGTIHAPKRTITVGMAAAATSGSQRPQVYVAAGTYQESLNLLAGVGIFGGYDATTGWSRGGQHVSHLLSLSATAISALGLAQPTELQLMHVTAADAAGTTPSGEGKSSIGILAVNSGAALTIAGCSVSAGAGAPGADGADGASGTPGATGGNAGQGNVYNPGAAGSSTCGAGGGAGAAGVAGLKYGNPGGTGTTVSGGGGSGGPGGAGGAPGQCGGVSSEDGHPAPAVVAGAPGNPGLNGSPGPAVGSFTSTGTYVPAPGGAGAQGRPGGGGGGGGSGGGSAHGTSVWNACSCTDIWSGGGGGGGGGGCGGQPGTGGRGGGGSFGIVSVNSAVTVTGTTVHSGPGGAGGVGGDGGPGGQGGNGGQGSDGQHSSSSCSSRRGGRGANGGVGGVGGRGGGASGGAGGPSICITYTGTQPTISGHTCSNGQPGAGGAGGTNGFQAAPSGAAGIAQALQAVP